MVEFSEKPQLGEGWINGGFFVLEPGVLDYIDSEDTHFQREPLERLAREGTAHGVATRPSGSAWTRSATSSCSSSSGTATRRLEGVGRAQDDGRERSTGLTAFRNRWWKDLPLEPPTRLRLPEVPLAGLRRGAPRSILDACASARSRSRAS